jgi:HEAT repeat protein
MIRAIFGWEFDWPEFLIGFALGAFVAWVMTRFSSFFLSLGRQAWSKFRETAEGFTAGAGDRYRSDVLARAQALHLARAIFALEEILFPPRLLAPPPSTDPLSREPPLEEIHGVLPNIPGLSYFAGLYRSSTLPLIAAVESGANLLITGDPGSGRTAALAYLAIASAKKDPNAGAIAELIPVLVHALDIRLEPRASADPLVPLLQAAQRTASTVIESRVPAYLRVQFRQRHALLLLDGLDELTPDELPPFADWLIRLQQAYPGNRIIAAGPASGHDGLVRAGLSPMAIAPWGRHEQRAFLTLWCESWSQFIAPALPRKSIEDIDPALIVGWLAGSARTLSPLELTLRVWAAYTGDVRGPGPADSLESYVSRFLSPDERPAAEAIASTWLSQHLGAVPERSLPKGIPISDLVEAGILVRRPENRLSFFHPLVGAYLAAKAMASGSLPEYVSRFGWEPADAAVQFYAAWGDVTSLVQSRLQVTGDPLERNVLSCAPLLRGSPPKAAWRGQLLRAIAVIAQDSKRPYGLRLRCSQALAVAAEPSVSILFRRMLTSEAPGSRILAGMGLGAVRDEVSIDKLIAAANNDPDLEARQAACLGLAVLGSETALEALGKILLTGEEAPRLAAAEALACDPDEGANMLREAVTVDNLLTRRAAVFGLGRVPQPWVAELLDKVVIEDKEWVVRGAAAEAAERRRTPPWKVHRPVGDVAQLPWLVAFAAREGTGVTSGRPALEMLRKALTSGELPEKIAALQALAWSDTAELSLEVYQALASTDAKLRDAAFETLWRQAAAGLELPSPQQLGVH